MTAEASRAIYYPLYRRYAKDLEDHLSLLGLSGPLVHEVSRSVHQFTQKGDHLPCVVVRPELSVSLRWASDRTSLPTEAFLLELRPEEMIFQSGAGTFDLGLPEDCSIEEAGMEKTLTFEGNRGRVCLRKNFVGDVTIKMEEKVG